MIRPEALRSRRRAVDLELELPSSEHTQHRQSHPGYQKRGAGRGTSAEGSAAPVARCRGAGRWRRWNDAERETTWNLKGKAFEIVGGADPARGRSETGAEAWGRRREKESFDLDRKRTTWRW